MASAILVAARSMASSHEMRSQAISSAPRGPERLSGYSTRRGLYTLLISFKPFMHIEPSEVGAYG